MLPRLPACLRPCLLTSLRSSQQRSYSVCLRSLPTLSTQLAQLQQKQALNDVPSFLRRQLSTSSILLSNALPFEVDHRVQKDILLYNYPNERYFKYLTWFGIIQFIFWTYLAQFSYSSLRDVKDDKGEVDENGEKKPWWRRINLGQNKYKNGIAILCLVLGYFLLFFTVTLSLRSVQRIVLMKGGRKVAVQTFAPLGKTRTIEIPKEHISATKSRQASLNSMALKLKGRSFYFLLDGRGKFYNTDLFDYVVALKRKF